MILLVPAYGRSYKTQAECSTDWNKGLDFKIYKGPYTSIRDTESLQEIGDIEIWWNFGSGGVGETLPVTGKE